jgi:hypothetical protein
MTAVLGALGVACSSAAQPAPSVPASQPQRTVPAERFFPLKDDTIYAFDTQNEETGEKGLLVMSVTRPRAERADLTVGGRIQRLELRPDGIAIVTGGYILKTPLKAGVTWKGQFGQVTLTAVDAMAEVPAGHFVGCVQTVEEAVSRTASKKVTSTFCPDVGLVSLDVEAVGDEGLAHERAVLRSFGKPVDLGVNHGEKPTPPE